jgi:molybdopterin molybdotransferase
MTLHEPTWDQARAAAHASAEPLDVEIVPIQAAHARVLAVDVRPLTPLPPWDYSAMDGWAVHGPGPWRIVGQVLAGTLPTMAISAGECVVIATGAPVPEGTTAVLRREDGTVDADGEVPRVTGVTASGRDIRWAGEECRIDEVLVPAGAVITPAVLGALCAGGTDEVQVRRRPRAHLLVFGDEILESGAPRDGRVRDSLGPQIPLWLSRMGVDVVGVTSAVTDTLTAHVDAINACGDVDLVITTGGTAAGPVDHLHEALLRCGADLIVDQVACRPGHPQLLASLGAGRHLLGLPGNPQSAVVALMTMGVPLVAALTGQPLTPMPEVAMTADVTAPARETRLVAAVLSGGVATPVDHLGSGMLRGLAAADGFAVIPPGGVSAGSVVRWLALPV